MAYRIHVNGVARSVEAPADMPVLWVLRDLMDLTGTKFGCGVAQCGACTVLLDGEPIRSCVTPIGSVGAGKITTIEAIDKNPVGAKVQAAWLDIDVVQCGYCQSGQVLAATALLTANKHPTARAGGGGLHRVLTQRVRAHRRRRQGDGGPAQDRDGAGGLHRHPHDAGRRA